LRSSTCCQAARWRRAERSTWVFRKSSTLSSIETRVAEAIALVRLEELADRGTDQLSGGQQQRVALARALVMQPKVLLLDEPLGALDLKLRQAMQEELRRIHRQTGGTFVFVTHDQSEALGLADRIAVMETGHVVQEGGPEEIYARPATRFVSTFIGEANVLTGRRERGRVILDSGPAFVDGAGLDGAVVAVIRPEAIRVAEAAAGADHIVEGEVVEIVYLGAYVRVAIRLGDGTLLAAHHPEIALRQTLRPGTQIAAGWLATDQRIIEDD
jgi:ABC-type Fe3+/spermidine/putrescine transport system ATPase subunit